MVFAPQNAVYGKSITWQKFNVISSPFFLPLALCFVWCPKYFLQQNLTMQSVCGEEKSTYNKKYEKKK